MPDDIQPINEEPVEEPGKLNKQLLAALGSALAVVAITVAVVASGDDPSKVDPTGDGGVIEVGSAEPPRVEIKVDPAAYHAQVKAYRDQHPGTVDLLTGAVEPGATVTTGVTVDLGKRATDVQALGGSWTISPVTARDDEASTWLEVTATNTGTEPARFVGMMQVEP